MMIVISIFASLALLYLGLSALYLLLYSVAGHHAQATRDEQLPVARDHARIAVFIPGYKEDAVILHTAKHSLTFDYPKEKWELIIVADSMQPETLVELRRLPLRLVEVTFDKSTKAKALNRAMAEVGDEFDLALILDADNLAQIDFLYRINDAYQAGFQAIQGHRVAKNLDTPIAILDAMSEEINNHIFSAGHRALNLSSRLVGSGMAFHYQLFKTTMAGVDAIGGFDKELELKLIGGGVKVAYLPSAKVYDEKVAQAQHFSNQRRRWIAAQFHYAGRFWGKAFRAFVNRGQVDFFDKANQMILPPRLILPGLLALGTLLALISGQPGWIIGWSLALLANVVAFAMAIPAKLYEKQYLRAFLALPRAFFVMALSLLKLKGSNKTFIHTPHSTTDLKDMTAEAEAPQS